MKLIKVKDVRTPERGTQGSAGIDFFVPNVDTSGYVVHPGCGVKIPSGIHVNVPDGHALIAMNKSGVATKKNLIVGACVVDSDYQGEVHLHVINVGNTKAFISPGDKLVQFLLVPVSHQGVEVVEEFDELYESKTERGDGGFGSTGS